MKVADTRGFTFKAFKHLKGNLKLCIHQSVSLTVLYCIVDNMLTISTIFTLLTLSVKTLETSKKQYQALIQAISKSSITDSASKKVHLQTGVYLSVERSNTVTRPSPDTVANTVLVVQHWCIFFSTSFTSNKEPKRHHQHKRRGQIYAGNWVIGVGGWAVSPQDRNLVVHVPHQHIVFRGTAKGKRFLINWSPSERSP